MSGSSGLKPPSIFARSTGAKPKPKTNKLTSPKSSKSSPISLRKQEANFETTIISETKIQSASSSPRRIPSQNLECSPKRSPRRFLASEDRQQIFQHQNPSPKRSPRRILSLEDDIGSEMGLAQLPTSASVAEDSVMSFLEFESLYTLEKELMQSKSDILTQLDEKCIFGGWFGPRRGVYTDLPDPIRNSDAINSQAVADTFATQTPSEGFSFAPGWALNAEHFYQWQQRGKTTQQVN